MGRPSLIPPNLNGHVYASTQIVDFLSQRCQFSMYFNAQVPVNSVTVPAEQADIFQYWNVTVKPLLLACLSTGTTCVEFRTWCMTWPNLATLISDMAAAPGTRAGDPLPPQIALVLSKRTGLRGKSARGRMYLCGMSETDSTLGVPVAGLEVAAQALCSQLQASFVGATTGATFNPVVVSLIGFAKASTGPPPGLVPTPPPIMFIPGARIETMVPDKIWNTQRSRTIGVGR
jgi:hypothetical protein